MRALIIQAIGTAAIVAGAFELDRINQQGPERCESHVDSVIGATPDGKAHLALVQQCWGALSLPTSGRILRTY